MTALTSESVFQKTVDAALGLDYSEFQLIIASSRS